MQEARMQTLDEKLLVYVAPNVREAYRREAVRQKRSISFVCREVLSDWASHLPAEHQELPR
jgi:hypothetical protein